MDILATTKILSSFVRTELVAKSQKDEKSNSDIFTAKSQVIKVRKKSLI